MKIHTPLKLHTVNLTDIKDVKLVEDIPINIWVWHKYNPTTATFYFVAWTKQGVLLTMIDSQKIVVSPARRDKFIKELKRK